jgi:hypothetical protein
MLAERKRRIEHFHFHPLHPTFALFGSMALLGLLACYIVWTVE